MSRERDLLARALEHMQEGDGEWDAELAADIGNHLAVDGQMTESETLCLLGRLQEEMCRLNALLITQGLIAEQGRDGKAKRHFETSGYLTTSEPVVANSASTEPVGNPDTLPEQDEEPVAYLYDLNAYCDHRPEQDVLAKTLPSATMSEYVKNVRPLYLHPAPRKPEQDENEEEDERAKAAGKKM